MHKYLLISTILVSFLYGSSTDLNLLFLEKYTHKYTISSNISEDIKTTNKYNALGYFHEDEKYLYALDYTYMSDQEIATTKMNNIPVDINQKFNRVRLGIGYKFNLSENFYISPALVYQNLSLKSRESINLPIGTQYNHTTLKDDDLSLYGVFNYRPFKGTSIMGKLEIENDLLSNDYQKDYSTLPMEIIVSQFINKDIFLFGKYGFTFKEKDAKNRFSGEKDVSLFSFGIGFSF